MFKRRNKKSPFMRIKDFFWPSAGWKRSTQYLGHRVARLPGTPSSIACGFACGAAVSFTPFIGLHFVFGALLAWLMRGNIIASAIGTAVGNPWTFPFIWVGIYKIGAFVIGTDNLNNLPNSETMNRLLDAGQAFFINGIAPGKEVMSIIYDIFLPMFIGGIPVAIIAWFAFFYPIKMTINQYQKARIARKNRHAALRKKKKS